MPNLHKKLFSMILSGLFLLPSMILLLFYGIWDIGNAATMQLTLTILPDIIDQTNTPAVATPEGYFRVNFDSGEGVLDMEKKLYDVYWGSFLPLDMFPNYLLLPGYTNAFWQPERNTIIVEPMTFTLSAKKEEKPGQSGGGSWIRDKIGSIRDKRHPSPSDIQKTSIETTMIDSDIFNPSLGQACIALLDQQTIDQGIEVSEYFKTAHQMLYSYMLTSMRGTADFAPSESLSREQAARFMVEFARNVLCRIPSRTYDDHFIDLDNADPTLLHYIKLSYDYQIFNGDNSPDGNLIGTTFRPSEEISIDELSTILVRLISNHLYPEIEWDWAANYRAALDFYRHESLFENTQRATIAELVYDVYKNNLYVAKEVGYVVKW